ncbi:MAG: 50S ribosomal protein L7/L12 [bacterium]|nr:50S ribosomal protein L7/L12 [bacterium]
MAEEIKEEKVDVPAKFKKLVEEIESMNVLDLSELVKILEKKFGVSAAMPVAMGAVPAGANGGAGEVEEKTEFDVVLTSYGEKKIDVIKVVKDISGKGLKEAKDLVDAVDKGAQVIKEKAKKEEADEMKKKIETAGGKVELK